MRGRQLISIVSAIWLSLLMAETGTAAGAQQKAACGRECLMGFLDNYLAALVKHNPAQLPTTPNVRYTENGEAIALGEGLWKTAVAVKSRQYFADPLMSEAAMFGVIDEGGQIAVLALRMRVVRGKITELETIVARKIDHTLFAPEALLTPNPIYEQILAAPVRSPREQMITAANSYFNGIEEHSGTSVPFDAQCNRIENGVQTTNNQAGGFPSTCAESLTRLSYIDSVRDRRFPLVDTDRGLVFTMLMFDIPRDATLEEVTEKKDDLPPAQRVRRSLLLAEVFKIVSGKITAIEAFMVNKSFGSPSGWN